MENVSRMKELISRLNQAAKVYYQGQGEVMSNFEYDKLYDELLALEKADMSAFYVPRKGTAL